jgi:hypothetical protein
MYFGVVAVGIFGALIAASDLSEWLARSSLWRWLRR